MSVTIDQVSITLTWPGGASGYILQESGSIGAAANWTNVAGVTGNEWTGQPRPESASIA